VIYKIQTADGANKDNDFILGANYRSELCSYIDGIAKL
jgi:hypothetical protein